jgi:hypothetical protein
MTDQSSQDLVEMVNSPGVGGPDSFEVTPDDDFLYYLRRGGELLRGGDAERARNALERAFELRPENPKVQNLLGLAYFKLGLLEAAKAIYDRLVQEFPNETPLYVNLGLVLLRQGRILEAERALRNALLLSPNHTRAHCYLGLVLYRRGDLNRAREHFLKGDAPDFARKVEKKLAAGNPPPPAPDEVLRAVAEQGSRDLDSSDLSMVPVENPSDERVLRDEDAWETKVAHQDSEVRKLLSRPLPSASAEVSSTGLDVSAILRAASGVHTAFDIKPGSVSAPPPGSVPLETMSSTSEDVPEVPEELAFGILPEAAKHQGSGPIQAVAAPAPEKPPPVPELVVEEGLVRRSSIGVPGRGSFAPPPPSRLAELELPLAEPSLRLLRDLTATPGFSAGQGSCAHLSFEGEAHVRTSAMTAVLGRASFASIPLLGPVDPLCQLTGRGDVLLRVPHTAAVVRDLENPVVPATVLYGFQAARSFTSRSALGIDVVHLSGSPSLLVDAKGPLVLAEVQETAPLFVDKAAVLAWTDRLSLSLARAGEADSWLLCFSGAGLVIFSELTAR